MLLLKEVSFSVINNLGTPSSELQINFSVLQIDKENSATEYVCMHIKEKIIIKITTDKINLTLTILRLLFIKPLEIHC